MKTNVSYVVTRVIVFKTFLSHTDQTGVREEAQLEGLPFPELSAELCACGMNVSSFIAHSGGWHSLLLCARGWERFRGLVSNAASPASRTGNVASSHHLVLPVPPTLLSC